MQSTPQKAFLKWERIDRVYSLLKRRLFRIHSTAEKDVLRMHSTVEGEATQNALYSRGRGYSECTL